MIDSTMMLALLMALMTGIGFVVFSMGMNIWGPLFYGLIAGIVAGDVNLGIVIGASCTLFSMGFYNYGGSVMPDFSIGAIFGVFAALQTAPAHGHEAAINQAFLAAAAVAVIMLLFDILGRSLTTVFLHAGSRALARRNLKTFQRWHIAGTIPLFLSRFVPVFTGMLFINEYQKAAAFANSVEWFQRGLGVVGAALPAAGLALLLTRMQIGAYWPFMLAGYLLFAYLNVPVIGLAITGLAAAGLYMRAKEGLFAKGGE
jgi:PTS system mannose-specific IIC component